MTSSEKETVSKSCKKTKDSFLEMILETDDSKTITNDKTQECDNGQDKDKLTIDYENYLKTLKNGTKRKNKGKVDFLVDKEQFGDHSLQMYRYQNEVQKHEQTRTDCMQMSHENQTAEDPESAYESNSSTGKKITSEVEELPHDKSVSTKSSDESASNSNLKRDEVVNSKRNPSHNIKGEAIKNGSTVNTNERQREKTEKGRKNKLSNKKNNQQLKEVSFVHSDKISQMSTENDQVKIGEKKAHTETQKEADGENQNAMSGKDSVLESLVNSETPITGISPDHTNLYLLNELSSSGIQSTVDERGGGATKNKKPSRKNEKKQKAQDGTESINDNAGRKVKRAKVKRKPKNKADSLETKVIKKRKCKEQTEVDDSEELQVVNDIAKSDLFSTTEDFCEINSVNENQPTAVQAWACNSEEKGKDASTPSDKCELLHLCTSRSFHFRCRKSCHFHSGQRIYLISINLN